jgi:hypothetical protein
MYLSSTDKIEVVLSGVITTNQLQCVASYQLITSAGVTLPESSTQANTNSTTPIDLVTGAASTNTEVVEMTIFNADTVAATVTVTKDVSGSNYILVRALLQVGDTLMYSRNGQWSILKSSSQESIIFTSFLASGTWTKSSGLKRILGCIVGAGGGSGSGRRGAAASNRFGGGGGGGGEVVFINVSADSLSSTVAVTIGTGGTGGTAITADDTSGNAGKAGGDSSFGAMAIAKGGSGGGGGTNLAGGALGAGGAIAAGTPTYGPYALSGANGAAGNTVTTAAGATGFIGTTGAPGGGGGGGINSSNTVGVAAMTGGAVYQNGVLQTGPVSGATPNGVNDKSVFLHFSQTLTSGYGLGTGGAGGVPATPNGGNGGRCAGAGGGAGVLNGTNSGAGGNGGDGLAVIMEFY